MKLNTKTILRYIKQHPEIYEPNTTQAELEELAQYVISKGKRTSKPHLRVQFYELPTKFQGRVRRFKAVVDTVSDQLITIYPMSI